MHPEVRGLETLLVPLLLDHYRPLNPKDVYGKPVFEGKTESGKIRVPVAGEFAAFVALRGE